MKESIKKGIYFGIASGVITTVGLMAGLNSSTGSKLVVLGGIFTIAIADALSDALGMHLSEESTNHKSNREVWESTFYTFLSKLCIALSFVAAVLIFPLAIAVYINILWGAVLISFASHKIAREQMTKSWHVIGEHLLIMLIVVAISHEVGHIIARVFGE